MPLRSVLTDEERELFRTSVGPVLPLSKGNKIQVSSVTPIGPAKIKSPLSNLRHKDMYSPPLLDKQATQAVESVGPETPLKFVRSGLQNRVIQRLRRREFVIEGVLDLHGFTLVQAEDALAHFLAHALTQQWRCVQIIHGKGARSEDGTPPLKNGINTWLRAYPVVLAFCSASVRDGGAGAVYVLLKSHEKKC